jgi:DNA-binding NarL/FixJ family response regulator
LLTECELAVAGHVARGLTNKETATLLYVSPHTVDYNLRQIFRRLDVRSRVEMGLLTGTTLPNSSRVESSRPEVMRDPS